MIRHVNRPNIKREHNVPNEDDLDLVGVLLRIFERGVGRIIVTLPGQITLYRDYYGDEGVDFYEGPEDEIMVVRSLVSRLFEVREGPLNWAEGFFVSLGIDEGEAVAIVGMMNKRVNVNYREAVQELITAALKAKKEGITFRKALTLI